MNIRSALVVLLSLLATAGCNTVPSNQASTGVPPSPSGFSWHQSVNGTGSFLKPNGWFVKEESKGKTNAVFISKENIVTNGHMVTGMSVNQVNDWTQSNSSKPSQYASAFAAKIATTGKVLKSGVVRGNQDDMHVVRVLGVNNGIPTIVHHLAIGMDSKDQVYLISYESPETNWESNYRYAKEMLNFFILGS
jgi:hypothetical protein